MEDAVKSGNWEIIQTLPRTATLITELAIHGHLECIMKLHELGCEWISSAPMFAAYKGHLDCLQYLIENGCPYDVYVCDFAVAGNQIECLKYAHEKGLPWREKTCELAAGRLEMLKYLHENGCPWDSSARLKNKIGCLEYAIEHGCT